MGCALSFEEPVYEMHGNLHYPCVECAASSCFYSSQVLPMGTNKHKYLSSLWASSLPDTFLRKALEKQGWFFFFFRITFATGSA